MHLRSPLTLLIGLAFLSGGLPVCAQSNGISLDPNIPPSSGKPFERSFITSKLGVGCNQNCNVIDFEGLGDSQPIGTIPGTPTVTFGPSWLALVDADTGGNGNFANEPSPSTIAFFLTPADPITFSEGVNFVEVFYSAAAQSIPVTLAAYDGPNGTGNLVDFDMGLTVGTSYDGAPCAGDPNGDFCLWDVLTLTSSTNEIRSLVLTGAVENYFGFDSMTFCVTGDADGDSLLDDWETCGIDVDDDGTVDLDLPAMGADPNVPDIFVEVDAMVGRGPSQATLDRVAAAFAAQGITLHNLLDETNIPLASFPASFGDFDTVKAARFGTVAERANANWANIRDAKRQVFHYCIFADQYGGGGSSGLAELGGNDFMVTLGHPSWPTTGGTLDQQAGTYMHEFGHNLGLRHGGSDNANYKPNYHSIMNYTWQLPMTSNAANWDLVYSDQLFPSLDESDLSEAAGLGGHVGHAVPVGPPPFMVVVESGAVDWNRDGDKTDVNLAEDVNHLYAGDAASPGETHTSFDDWAAIDFNFRDSPDYADGVHIHTTLDTEIDADTFVAMAAEVPEPSTYCVPKANSLGCVPTIGHAGTPSLVNPQGFTITADNILSQQSGILMWGLVEGSSPLGGGTLCIQGPLYRYPIRSSGGNPTSTDCSGTYSTRLGQMFLDNHGLDAGTVIYAQYLCRDPGYPAGESISLTDALILIVGP